MKNYRLKRSLIGLLLIATSLAWADDEYRTFRSVDGREILASITGYDTETRSVELEVKGGKQGRIPLSSLSPEDQAYVREWSMDRACFLSDELFRVKLKDDDGGWQEHMGTQEERFTRYTLQLENHGKSDLNGLHIVCCEIREKDGARRFSHSELETEKLLAGGKVEEEKELRSFRNEPRKILDSVIGVRMRLYWTDPDGHELVREVFAPRKLSDEQYPWKDPANKHSKPVVDLTPQEWNTRFVSDKLFKINLIEDDYGWDDYLGTVEARYTRYVLALTNRGNADLDGIRIVCCEIRDQDGTTAYYHHGMETTNVFAEDTVEEGKVLFSRRNTRRDTINSVIGVRMRLYWTSPDGNELMREISAPEQLSETKYPWKEPEDSLAKQEGAPQEITGNIRDVSTKETEHSTKKRGTYKAQTFEYSYSISACASYRISSFFEFKDRRGNITFMSSQSYYPKGPNKQTGALSILHIDAEEHELKNVELNAYCIQIYATDESGEMHLVTEAHDGCTSLEELKQRNAPPIGV